MNWQVYMILCSDGSLYTGITTDVGRRFGEHARGSGAKFFRGRRPVQIVYLETGHDRATATRRELALKRLRPAGRRQLAAISFNQSDRRKTSFRPPAG